MITFSSEDVRSIVETYNDLMKQVYEWAKLVNEGVYSPTDIALMPQGNSDTLEIVLPYNYQEEYGPSTLLMSVGIFDSWANSITDLKNQIAERKKKEEERTEAAQRAQYERLKAKFEDK